MNNEFYMQKAIIMAKKAEKLDEVPIGAVIIDNKTGEIIAQSHNQTAHIKNATSHAEMLVIEEACTKLGTNRLRGCDLYVTLEPCTMCAAAISFARIENLFFGATDEKGGAVISGVKFYESPTCHHKPNVEYGILENECSTILKAFFKSKRKSKKTISENI